MSLQDYKISTVKTVKDTDLPTVQTVESAYTTLRKQAASQLFQIKELILAGTDKKSEAYKRIKESMPAIAFSATFADSRGEENASHHSGLVAFDIENNAPLTDGESEQQGKHIEMLNHLLDEFSPIFAYITPRFGIRLVLCVPELKGELINGMRQVIKDKHKAFYAHILKRLESFIKLHKQGAHFEADPATSAIASVMFPGYECFSASNFKRYTVPAVTSSRKPKKATSPPPVQLQAAPMRARYDNPRQVPDYDKFSACLDLFPNSHNWDDYDFVCQVSSSVPGSEQLALDWASSHPQFDSRDMLRKINSYGGLVTVASFIERIGTSQVYARLRQNGMLAELPSAGDYTYSFGVPVESDFKKILDEVSQAETTPPLPDYMSSSMRAILPAPLFSCLEMQTNPFQRDVMFMSFLAALSSLTKCNYAGSPTQATAQRCNLNLAVCASSGAGKSSAIPIPQIVGNLQEIKRQNMHYRQTMKDIEAINALPEGEKNAPKVTARMLAIRDNPQDYLEPFTLNIFRATTVQAQERLLCNNGYGLCISSEAAQDLRSWEKLGDHSKGIKTMHLHAPENEIEDYTSKASGDLSVRVRFASVYTMVLQDAKQVFFNKRATTDGLTSRFLVLLDPSKEEQQQGSLLDYYPADGASTGDINHYMTRLQLVFEEFASWYFVHNQKSSINNYNYGLDPHELAEESAALQRIVFPRAVIEYMDGHSIMQRLKDMMDANKNDDRDTIKRDQQRVLRIYLLLLHLAVMYRYKDPAKSEQSKANAFEELRNLSQYHPEQNPLLKYLFEFSLAVVYRCAHDRELIVSTNMDELKAAPVGEQVSSISKAKAIRLFLERNPQYLDKPQKDIANELNAQMPGLGVTVANVKKECFKLKKGSK